MLHHILVKWTDEVSDKAAYDDCPTHHRWKDEYGHLVAKKAIFDCD